MFSLKTLVISGDRMPRHQVPRVGKGVISKLRSRVLKSLRVIYDDGTLLVSPSFSDAELECVLLDVLRIQCKELKAAGSCG